MITWRAMRITLRLFAACILHVLRYERQMFLFDHVLQSLLIQPFLFRAPSPTRQAAKPLYDTYLTRNFRKLVVFCRQGIQGSLER